MIQKMRLVCVVFILFFMVSGLMSVAIATEPPCRQRVLKLCEEDEGAMICRLLSYDAPETVESISGFLEEIGHLHSDIQQDLICARLMGKKQIINLDTTLDHTSDASRHTFQSGIATFKFKIGGANYSEVIKAHQKLKKFKLCPSDGIQFDITGMVMDVDTEYYNNNDSLKSFVFTMDEVRLSNIRTIYASGGFDVQRKPLEKRIDAEYQRYFKAGAKKSGKRKQKDLKTYTNSIGMAFVLIPVGSEYDAEEDNFECKNEEPAEVNSSFYIGKHEVTQSQWETVMGNNPSHFKGSNRPVETVSWDDAQDFIQKLNQKEGTRKYRLPSEAEWEFAARAGSASAYCFGDDESRLPEYAWYDKNSGSETHAVGQLKPNAWGLYDMHGNVWEWVQDLYSSGSADRVLRGGSWNYSAEICRSDFRSWREPSDQYDDIGFRLALSQGQQ